RVYQSQGSAACRELQLHDYPHQRAEGRAATHGWQGHKCGADVVAHPCDPGDLRRTYAGGFQLALSRPLLVLAAALAACAVLAFGAAWPEPSGVLALVTLQPNINEHVGEALITSSGGRAIEHLQPLAVYRVAFARD